MCSQTFLREPPKLLSVLEREREAGGGGGVRGEGVDDEALGESHGETGPAEASRTEAAGARGISGKRRRSGQWSPSQKSAWGEEGCSCYG